MTATPTGAGANVTANIEHNSLLHWERLQYDTLLHHIVVAGVPYPICDLLCHRVPQRLHEWTVLFRLLFNLGHPDQTRFEEDDQSLHARTRLAQHQTRLLPRVQVRESQSSLPELIPTHWHHLVNPSRPQQGILDVPRLDSPAA